VNGTNSTDFRLAMRIVWVGSAAGVTSSLWPATDAPITIGLAASAAIALLVAVVRRELRIRSVLAAIQPLGPVAAGTDPAGTRPTVETSAPSPQTSDDVREVA